MKIYLAGPDVFRENPAEYGNRLKASCKLRGVEGLFPLDNELPQAVLDMSPREIATEIFKGNVAMIDQADAVVANISPFRGPGMDAGTAWEIGYAYAKGKPVFLYSSDHDVSYKRRADTAIGSCSVDSQEYPEIENFNLTENLMITNSSSRVYPNFLLALGAAAKLRGSDEEA